MKPKKTDYQDFLFSLTGGKKAILSVPTAMNNKDFELVEKQIEILKFQQEQLKQQNSIEEGDK